VINLGVAVKKAGIPEAPMAVISSGWQEAEGDIDDIFEQVQRPLHDLGPYQRAEELTAQFPEFAKAYRQRQDHLRDLQRLYRLRCKQLMIAARLTLRADASPEMLEAEQHHAMNQVRELDRHHLRSIHAIHSEFDQRFSDLTSGELQRHSQEIADLLKGCESILITGGNVMVLLNRLRLFGIDRMLADKHLVAWSAGAMVVSETVVLFHDKTPLGRRDPEVVSHGCGIIPGYVFLPNAKRRLRASDSVRTRLMCRRFANSKCVTLDNESGLLFVGDKLAIADRARVMSRDGRYLELTTK
jgi:hypothetical protein